MSEEKQNTSTDKSKEQMLHSVERAVAVQAARLLHKIAKPQENWNDKNTVKYRPRKEGGIYTRETIERFADEAVVFTSGTSKYDAQFMKRAYAHVLAKIPEWQQDLVMESRRTVVLDVPKSRNEYMKGSNEGNIIAGYFLPERNRISASLHSDNLISSHQTLSHEKGHQFDYSPEKQVFFSDGSDAWNQALRNEWEAGWRGEKLLEETFGDRRNSLFFGISSHLVFGGYKPEKFARETMAQMTAVYNLVYDEYRSELIRGKYYFLSDPLKNKELPPDIAPPDLNKKALEKTELLMERIYPDLFPVYRNEFIPHAIRKTTDLSKASDIEEKKILPKVTSAAKIFTTMFPTNIDNLAIASGVGTLSMIASKVGGRSIFQSVEIGIETAYEMSGFAATKRSWDAGREGNLKESAIQAVDALGIPAVAVREGINIVEKSPRLNDSCANAGISSMTHTISSIDKPIKPVFPEALPDTKLMEKIANKLKKGGMIFNPVQQAGNQSSESSKFIPYSAVGKKQPNVTPS